ncbi:MAG: NADH-quinone oxidoreductase subunit NuoG [Candidatus Hinthialibacter antarcticus]|nr:NADH-quinone oxidoreductase subunit NuoG [Candidatus Hinthialibacter antarcticus]
MSDINGQTVTLTIDGREITVPKGTSLIEAARQADIFIPHYCYDPDLSVVASCRLCLVEIEKVPKLQPSCNAPAQDGQVVFTQSEKVLDARKMQMEFLLVQHPLDCPVCDQGGECKLQEYSRNHGFHETRFRFQRRTFPKPDIGPFIDLERNRCVLCSRCVRFLDEKGGNAELAVVQRGNKSYISTFKEKPLQGDFTGNITDLCPVGALTSKVTRFRVRVWELKDAPSVCSMCSVGCNINMQHRNRTREVLRITPRPNEDVNHRWLCDMGRFGFDQFNSGERRRNPEIKNESGVLETTNWGLAINEAVKRLKATVESKGAASVAGLIGPRQSNEALFLFQQFMREAVGTQNIDHRTEYSITDNDDGYLTSLALGAVNQPLEEARRASDIIIVGSDLPNEAPILRLQVREHKLRGKQVLFAYSRNTRMDDDCSDLWLYHPGGDAAFLAGALHAVFQETNQTPDAETQKLLDSTSFEDAQDITQLSPERFAAFAKQLIGSEAPTLLLGESAYNGGKGVAAVKLAAALLKAAGKTSHAMPLSLVLPYVNSRGAADMGCYPHRGPGYGPISAPGKNTTEILNGCIDGSIQALVLCNVNLIEEYPDRALAQKALQAVPLLIVAGPFKYETGELATVFLPLSTYSEEDGTYTNFGGRVQRAEKALPQLDGTLSGYQVFLALGERWGLGWRQVRPPQIFEHISQAASHYNGLSWSKLGTAGQQSLPVDSSQFSIADASLPSLNGSPSGEYSYRLVGGRSLFDRAGEKRFAAPMVDRSAPCAAELHPDDAEALGVSEGESITVAGERGSVQLPARISCSTQSGCVTVLGRYDGVPLNHITEESTPWVKIQK